MSAVEPSAPGFSLTEARAIVRDLFVPNEKVYWIDFLTTIFVGHACYALTRHLAFEAHWEPLWLRGALALATFSIPCA